MNIRRLTILVFVIGLMVLAAIQLNNNKASIQAEAKLSQQKTTVIPVEVTTPEQTTIRNTIEANGSFAPNKTLYLIAETQGRVIQLFKKEGDYVRKGEVIAKVDDELLQAERIAIEANYKQTKADLERFENLVKGEAVTKKQLEQIKMAHVAADSKRKVNLRRIADTEIKSPISGSINMKFIEVGSFLGPGGKVCEIVDIGRLKLQVKVDEFDVLRIKKGQKAKIVADVHPTHSYTGKVTHIGLKGDMAHKYTVEILLTNSKSHPLKAGMYATAFFEGVGERPALLLDRKALVGSTKDGKVFVVREGKAMVRKLKIGEVREGKVEVLEGLREDEVVVLNGQVNLQEGTSVQVTNR